MKPTVLFVDDSSNVLSGLRRKLRKMRNTWNMAFAESGEDALALFSTTDIAVIVSDMQMPAMNGAELLSKVSEISPTTVRFVLTGETSKKSIPELIRTAHQFFTKPCEIDFLIKRIDRAIRYSSYLKNINLQAEVIGLAGLGIPQKIFNSFQTLKKKDHPSHTAIVDLIEQDIALVGKVLQIANSGFFGGHGKHLDLQGAVSFLGPAGILKLVGSSLLCTPSSCETEQMLLRSKLTAHSVECAVYASAIASSLGFSKKNIEAAYITGMLHNIGRSFELALGFDIDLSIASADNHANIEGGIYQTPYYVSLGIGLLGIWGFRDSVLQAIQYHMSPGCAGSEALDLLTVLHVAHNLSTGAPFDNSYLEKVGATKFLDEWKVIVSELKKTQDKTDG